MHVLLTGHEGYIGRVLVSRLKQAGHTVRGFDTSYFSDGTLGPVESTADEAVTKDIRQVEREDLADIKAVIHLAGLSDDPTGELDPELTDTINHVASLRLAGLVRDAGVSRFLFASSTSVYGRTDPSAIVDETSPTFPITAYAKSKLAAESGLRALATGSFTPVCLRLATAYGHSPGIRFCTLVVHNLMADAMSTGQIRLRTDGSPWRPLVHVEDICQAFVSALAADRSQIAGQVLNVGRTDQNFQISQVARIVSAAVPGSTISVGQEREVDGRSYRVRCDSIRDAIPDYQPEWHLSRGCQVLHDFLTERGFTPSHAIDVRYRRLEKLKMLLETGSIDEQLLWKK